MNSGCGLAAPRRCSGQFHLRARNRCTRARKCVATAEPSLQDLLKSIAQDLAAISQQSQQPSTSAKRQGKTLRLEGEPPLQIFNLRMLQEASM
jgi:hypothetical protein